MMKIKKAVIPAAGYGTRFLPATKSQPKEMLPIVDKPTIQYIVEEAVKAGIEEVLIITNHQKQAIENHFDRSLELEYFLEKNNKLEELEMVLDISKLINIHSIRQKEAKGLGNAILCAKCFVGDEPFAILLGDDIIVNDEKPVLAQLCDTFEKYQSSVVAVQQVEAKDISKYGIVNPRYINNKDVEVIDLVEKPNVENAPSDLAILGRYILTPEIFNILETQAPGHNGEVQLTDAIKTLLLKEKVYAHKFEGKYYDVGKKIGFLEANIDFALKRDDLREEFMQMLMKKVEDYKFDK